jgi:hypothetical protein
MVPKNVSLFFIETLNTLQQKRAEQKTHNITMENRLNFEKEKLNTAVGTKRLRQTQIDELVDYEAIALADKKIARYIFCTNHSFSSCEHLSYKEMISAVSKAGPSYVGPTYKMVRTRLLDQEYESVKARNEARMRVRFAVSLMFYGQQLLAQRNTKLSHSSLKQLMQMTLSTLIRRM